MNIRTVNESRPKENGMEASSAQFGTSQWGDAELIYGDFGAANTGTICTQVRCIGGWWVEGADGEVRPHVVDDFGSLVRKPRGCLSISA